MSFKLVIFNLNIIIHSFLVTILSVIALSVLNIAINTKVDTII